MLRVASDTRLPVSDSFVAIPRYVYSVLPVQSGMAGGIVSDHQHDAYSDHDHGGHDHHGHDHVAHHRMMIRDFRRRFYFTLILTLPVLAMAPIIQNALGYSLFLFRFVLPGVRASYSDFHLWRVALPVGARQ